MNEKYLRLTVRPNNATGFVTIAALVPTSLIALVLEDEQGGAEITLKLGGLALHAKETVDQVHGLLNDALTGIGSGNAAVFGSTPSLAEN